MATQRAEIQERGKSKWRVSLKLCDDEYERLMKVLERLRKRTHGYATKSDVLREAAGLSKKGILTEEDLKILRGR